MNWLWWKIDWPATALIHSGGPSSTPSARAVRTSWRASYESTHSAASWPMKRRECGAQPRVRRPTTARRTGRPTGAARRRARSRADTSAVSERLGELVSRPEPLEIRVDQQMHEAFEVERRRPAQLLACLATRHRRDRAALPSRARASRRPERAPPSRARREQTRMPTSSRTLWVAPRRDRRSRPGSSRWTISHIART